MSCTVKTEDVGVRTSPGCQTGAVTPTGRLQVRGQGLCPPLRARAASRSDGQAG